MDEEHCPFRLTVERERVELLGECLASIPAWARELILIHYVDGVTLAEIARRARVNVRTVYKWHARAINRIKHQLTKRRIRGSADL